MISRILKPQSHNEWLLARSKGIGSSDIGTIVGLNKFETPYQLWARKTGRLAPQEENEAMLMGHLLEDAVAQRWAIETQNDLIKSSAQEWIYVHPDVDYFRASPDRIYWGADEKHNEENKKVLECKTTLLDVSRDDIPKTWYCQVQWLLHCTGYKSGSLAWIKLNNRQFGYMDISYDADFAGWLAEEAEKFWKDNIIGGAEPAARTVADVVLKYPKELAGKSIEATADILQAYEQLKSIKTQLKDLDAAKSDLENQLKLFMADAEVIMNGKNKLCTWKASKDSVKFDAKKFQAEHEDECKDYMIPVKGNRTFLLK